MPNSTYLINSAGNEQMMTKSIARSQRRGRRKQENLLEGEKHQSYNFGICEFGPQAEM